MGIQWYADVRVLHIVFAALWVGASVLFALYVSPAIRSLGPHGAQVMAELMRRKVGLFIAASSMLTVLSGLWMYWEFSHGFDATIVTHGPGLALGIGGLCGIAAAIVGGAVIGRAAEQAGQLSHDIAQLPEGGEREALMQHLAKIQRRMNVAGRCDVVLLLAALILMSLAHVL